MGDNTITISTDEYRQSIRTEAKVEALMAYVNHTNYSVDRKLIGDILGIHVGGTDESNRESDGE